jgi:glycosyltransferase involved in cell wall biosynthesis
VIDTRGRTEEQVSSALAEALCSLASDEAVHTNLRTGALRKAEAFSWDSVIGGLYNNISEIIDQRQIQVEQLGAKTY